MTTQKPVTVERIRHAIGIEAVPFDDHAQLEVLMCAA
jgi:hypothetical protein